MFGRLALLTAIVGAGLFVPMRGVASTHAASRAWQGPPECAKYVQLGPWVCVTETPDEGGGVTPTVVDP